MDTKAGWCERGKYLLYAKIIGQNEGEDSQEFKMRQLVEESMKKMEMKMDENNKAMKVSLTDIKAQIGQIKESGGPEGAEKADDDYKIGGP